MIMPVHPKIYHILHVDRRPLVIADGCLWYDSVMATAGSIGKVRLENGNTPARPSLSEAARANMENFLEYILMVLPALRIDSFLAQTRPQLKPVTASPANGDDAPVLFELHTPRHGIHATARLEGGEFVVQAGSQSRGTWVGKGTGHTSYSKLLAELVVNSNMVLAYWLIGREIKEVAK